MKRILLCILLILSVSCNKISTDVEYVKTYVYQGKWENDTEYVLSISENKKGYFIENNVIVTFTYLTDNRRYIADDNYKKTYLYNKLKTLRNNCDIDHYLFIYNDENYAVIHPIAITKKEVELFNVGLNYVFEY